MPGRRPITQIAERPIQSKTRMKVSIPESSLIQKGPGQHDKVIPVSDYTIPQTMSECDSISTAIRRKDMQDMRSKISVYADPIYRPLPKPTEILLQVLPR